MFYLSYVEALIEVIKLFFLNGNREKFGTVNLC